MDLVKKIFTEGGERLSGKVGHLHCSLRLEQRCRAHVELDMYDPLAKRIGEDSVELLERVLNEWSIWKEQMVTIRAIFFFLDRSYLLSSSKPTLSELTPMLFRDIVVNSNVLKNAIIAGACKLVERERKINHGHDPKDETLFKQAVDMFHEVSTYTASFEPAFLTMTQRWIDELSNEIDRQQTRS